MVNCKECAQDLNEFESSTLPNSCTHEYVVIDEKNIYSREKFYSRKRTRCPACHVSIGGVHHFGCACEVCPKCLGGLIECSCNVTGLIKAKDIQTAENAFADTVLAQHK